MATHSTVYEVLGRENKVNALVLLLRSIGATAWKAATLKDLQWQAIANTAGVRKPSVKTQQQVCTRLKELETADRQRNGEAA